jgi:hypothetical protein
MLKAKTHKQLDRVVMLKEHQQLVMESILILKVLTLLLQDIVHMPRGLIQMHKVIIAMPKAIKLKH